jgi:hypothetical protein
MAALREKYAPEGAPSGPLTKKGPPAAFFQQPKKIDMHLNKLRRFFEKQKSSIVIVGHILGIILLPVFSFLRLFFHKVMPEFSLLASVVFFFLTFSIYVYYALIIPCEKIVKYFAKIMNLPIIQELLYFAIMFEQIILLHPLIFCTCSFSCTILYLGLCFSDGASLPQCFIANLVLTFFIMYYQLRNRLLNAKEFQLCGIDTKETTWMCVISGLSSVLAHKVDYTVYKSELFVSNQLGKRSDVRLPFFESGLRLVSTQSILKNAQVLVQDAINHASFSPIFGVVSASVAGLGWVTVENRKIAVENRKIDASMEKILADKVISQEKILADKVISQEKILADKEMAQAAIIETRRHNMEMERMHKLRLEMDARTKFNVANDQKELEMEQLKARNEFLDKIGVLFGPKSSRPSSSLNDLKTEYSTEYSFEAVKAVVSKLLDFFY